MAADSRKLVTNEQRPAPTMKNQWPRHNLKQRRNVDSFRLIAARIGAR